MTEEQNLLVEYDSQVDVYDAFRVAVEGVLKELVRLDGVQVHSITSRLKARDSVEEKLSREAKGGYERLSAMTDLVGLRVITYIEDDVDRVGDLVKREFVVDNKNSIDKRTVLDPDRFGYLSMHYVCSFGASRTCLAEHRRFDGLKFEIQIRSILQHAWAEIEHDLGYKANATIPALMRRRFSRLAGLLEIADDEFRRLRDELATYTAEVAQAISVKPSSVALDDVSLESYVKTSKRLLALDERLAEFRGVPLSEGAFPELAAMLKIAGIETIDALDHALDKYQKVVERQYERRLAGRPKPSRLQLRRGIGAFHLAQTLWLLNGGASLDEAKKKFGYGFTRNETEVVRQIAGEEGLYIPKVPQGLKLPML